MTDYSTWQTSLFWIKMLILRLRILLLLFSSLVDPLNAPACLDRQLVECSSCCVSYTLGQWSPLGDLLIKKKKINPFCHKVPVTGFSKTADELSPKRHAAMKYACSHVFPLSDPCNACEALPPRPAVIFFKRGGEDKDFITPDRWRPVASEWIVDGLLSRHLWFQCLLLRWRWRVGAPCDWCAYGPLRLFILTFQVTMVT